MEDKKEFEKQQFVIPPDLRPIYADEVIITSPMKVVIEKDDKGTEKIRKHGNIILSFFDNQTKIIVAKIVVNPLTAKALGNLLIKNSDKLLEELDKKEIPNEIKKQIEEAKKKSIKSTSDLTYIG